MLSRLQEPFGKAGLIVAVIALVAALVGGAYAANSATDSAKRHHKKKKSKGVTVAQVRKIAKQEAKKYANSNPGPAGPQGPAGANGNDGQNGANGSNGANGVSVASEQFAGEQGPCFEGGSKFTAADGDTFACNGEEGAEGSPWTLGGTLPSGETETGVWGAYGPEAGGPFASLVPVSFPIPLAAELTGSGKTKIVRVGDPAPAECAGGTAVSPAAAPGFLCVYFSAELGLNPELLVISSQTAGEQEGMGKAGTLLNVVVGAETASIAGTWAVTAP